MDPDRDASLDGETGLLVNHAYGLDDMKVCENRSELLEVVVSYCTVLYRIDSIIYNNNSDSDIQQRVENRITSYINDSLGMLWISPCSIAQSMVARSVEGRLVGRIGPLGRLSRGEYGLMGQGKNIGDKRLRGYLILQLWTLT